MASPNGTDKNARSPFLVGEHWSAKNDVTLFAGDCRELLARLPARSVQLVVTSPPYNIGKTYERQVSLPTTCSANAK